MNLITEIDSLPLASRLALIAHLLKTTRPTVTQLARASGSDTAGVCRWMASTERRYPRKHA